MKPLTELVVDYIRNEGYEVVDWRALEIPDNLEVGCHDPARLPGIVAQRNTKDVDAIVLSACVQMPSLPAVAKVEAMTGKPVIIAVCPDLVVRAVADDDIGAVGRSIILDHGTFGDQDVAGLTHRVRH